MKFSGDLLAPGGPRSGLWNVEVTWWGSGAVSDLEFSPSLAFGPSGGSPPVTIQNPLPSPETGTFQPVPQKSVQKPRAQSQKVPEGNRKQPGERGWALLPAQNTYPRSASVCCCGSLVPDSDFPNTEHGDVPGMSRLFGTGAVITLRHGHNIAFQPPRPLPLTC